MRKSELPATGAMVVGVAPTVVTPLRLPGLAPPISTRVMRPVTPSKPVTVGRQLALPAAGAGLFELLT